MNDEAIGTNHFTIRFCPFRNKYLIKDIENDSGTFIKIEEPRILQSGTVICIGKNNIIVGLVSDNLHESSELKVNSHDI